MKRLICELCVMICGGYALLWCMGALLRALGV